MAGAVALQARLALTPAQLHQPAAAISGAVSASSGLCVRRLSKPASCRFIATGGLLALPTRHRRASRIRCAVVEPNDDDSGSESDKENDKENDKEIAAVDGAASGVDGAASGVDGAASAVGGAASTVSGSEFKSRRDMLQEYVKNVQPEFMERFVQKAPSQVVEAMRQTVTNMLGTLPPQFFDIHVSTIAENLAQLMYSVMMTGYMFRNAQYRLELQQSLTQAALPVSSSATTDSRYAPGTQKSSVSGDVVRWRKDEERPERVDAVEYIELLEAEVEELRKQLEMRGRGKNELLEYLKSLQPQNLQELTTSAGEDALEAMNTFVSRLIGVADPTQLKRAATQTTAAELARILYWLMVVGYSIRNIEVRYDMERVLGVPAKLAELPPGETL